VASVVAKSEKSIGTSKLVAGTEGRDSGLGTRD
jgi:hypothetical protein